ncbi:MAG TPA: putative lipid II flippase FtsW [Actinomycetota bacterium]|nr:putative lipid II flippase FtsW [Actinomycetota bacterium]
MATHSTRMGARIRTRAERPKPSALSVGHPSVLISITVAMLVLLGLIMILSASNVASFAQYGSPFRFFTRQLLWTAAGVIAFAVCARTDYRRWRGVGYVAFAGVLLLLLLVLIPGIGISVGGSARWLGFGSFQFQPSEFAKLALVLFAADVFSRKKESTFDTLTHTMLPLVPALGALSILIMLQPDLGTTLLLGAIGAGMMFVAGAPLRYLGPTLTAGAGVAILAAVIEPYRRDRVLAFLDPWKDPFNTGYQTIQSLIAVGSGGWFGVGLGASRQKWLYIPNAHTDFIFAILAEETGLLGSLMVIGMFAFLGYLGVRTARKAPDRFGMLVATGITVWVSAQAVVNMGAVSASLPITGVPLPLVSFGGSSLVISLAAMGMLVNIAYQGRPSHRSPQRMSNGATATRGA